MSQSMEMRNKLEMAVKASRSNAKLSEQNGQNNVTNLSSISSTGPGSIILKTDFSNFTKKS